jgi:hypothetical protein
MLPRKFFYEEHSFFSTLKKIEFIDGYLDIQSTTPCIPYLIEGPCKQVSDAEWLEVEQAITALNLKPRSDDLILDGCGVDCWITFKRRLVKFYIINPEFEGFNELRKIINRLSICEAYPEGVLESY